MRQSLLIYAESKGAISMAERDVRQDLEATLTFRAHSSHGAAGCVCFPGPKLPVLPLPCLAFPEHKLQQEEVPSAGLCCRAASLPPSGSDVRCSPEAQAGSGGAQLCSSAADPPSAGCPGAGGTALPSSGTGASPSPAGKAVHRRVGSFVTKTATKRLLSSQHAFKHPHILAMDWARPSCCNILLQKILPETLFTPFWLPPVR